MFKNIIKNYAGTNFTEHFGLRPEALNSKAMKALVASRRYSSNVFPDAFPEDAAPGFTYLGFMYIFFVDGRFAVQIGREEFHYDSLLEAETKLLAFALEEGLEGLDDVEKAEDLMLEESEVPPKFQVIYGFGSDSTGWVNLPSDIKRHGPGSLEFRAFLQEVEDEEELNAQTYTFSTQEELDAFVQGVEEAVGWLEHIELTEAQLRYYKTYREAIETILEDAKEMTE